jgi:hypothetical protein
VRARCTVCSNVIAVSRVAEAAAPATPRSRPQHMPKTADRVANSLGDAFIPAPDDSDLVTTAPPPPPPAPTARSSEGTSVPVFADPELNVVTTMPVERPLARPEKKEPPPPPRPEPRTPSTEELASQRTEPLPAIPMPQAGTPPKVPPAPVPPLPAMPRAVAEPALEDEPSDASVASAPTAGPAAPPRPEPASSTAKSAARVSRPFSLPRDLPPPPLPSASPPKTRPTAPVFRATPGHPVQTAQAAPTPSPTRSDAGKPINPFLSRDPRQKARRLARALISDMIVYQPEKRQKALREGNLAESFREEIKKSWQEYVEQVGDEIASSTTHFNDALNDILAGGQKVF